MPWFASGRSPYETARAMIGAKAGDRVLVVGADDPGLAADTALITGLNGRTLVVDAALDMQARVDAAAARAGALVETAVSPTHALPLDAGTFDIVVVQIGPAAEGSDLGLSLAEAGRVARAGGRVMVIARARRAGIAGGLFGKSGSTIDGAEVCRLMTAAGLRAARVLAENAGAIFVEAIKARQGR